ncbi:MAG: hypothetical protein ACKOSQ_12725 [Planctomycetaceae bacterium]
MTAVVDEVLAVETLSIEAVRSLLDPPEPPCLSLYMPTHRNVPDNTVDRPTFARLVAALETELAATRSRAAVERLLHPFDLLATDARFWQHTQDGLAVLAAGGHARVFPLQRPVAPLAVAGDRFHVMPLLRAATALERFTVLALTSRSARVWAGRVWHDPRGASGERLDPVPLVATPGREPVAALVRPDVISAETVEPHRVKHGMGPAGRGATAFVHGGFGSRRDDIDRDTEIFLRHVDEVVHEQVSRPGELPLVLVAQARLAATFRGLSANPLLGDEPVDLDPHLLAPDELLAAVVPVFARARAARIEREVRAFAHARDRDLGASDLADVARAAVAGQVATLLVEADRCEAGRFDRATGAIAFGGPAAGGEDVYGAVAETVLAKGGTVVSLARNSMPTESGVAAIYRYA